MAGLGKIGEILASPIIGLAKDFTETRRFKKETQSKILMAEAEAKVKMIEAEARIAEKRAEGDVNWEAEMAKASSGSWKDEYLTIIFTIPLIMAFIPALAPYVGQGFDNLDKAPQWYMISVGTVVSGAFGLRIYDKFIKRNK
jgi:hypothetical protein